MQLPDLLVILAVVAIVIVGLERWSAERQDKDRRVASARRPES